MFLTICAINHHHKCNLYLSCLILNCVENHHLILTRSQRPSLEQLEFEFCG